ncbi:hypothetical protein VNO77_30253 [Canavalia gladiata]|uniref:Uncharacterized protein n=1 Tax=Canavalia gladiata TaxID=3824 RepID=A0AAN9Q1A6_CANGL
MCRVVGHSCPLLLSWTGPSSCVMYGYDCVFCQIKNNTRVIYAFFFSLSHSVLAVIFVIFPGGYTKQTRVKSWAIGSTFCKKLNFTSCNLCVNSLFSSILFKMNIGIKRKQKGPKLMSNANASAKLGWRDVGNRSDKK